LARAAALALALDVLTRARSACGQFIALVHSVPLTGGRLVARLLPDRQISHGGLFGWTAGNGIATRIDTQVAFLTGAARPAGIRSDSAASCSVSSPCLIVLHPTGG
jgi:hypothetical protein